MLSDCSLYPSTYFQVLSDDDMVIAAGFSLQHFNISAQLWSETCKKFSPIEYMECTLVREQDLNQPDLDYVPDILKEGVVRYRHFPADEDGTTVKRQASNEEIIAAYGTFEENI